MPRSVSTRRHIAAAALACVTAVGLSACSGVPGASSTRTVKASEAGSKSDPAGAAGPSSSSSTTNLSGREVFSKTQDRVATYKSVAFSGPMDFEGESADVAIEGTTDGNTSRADIKSDSLGSLEVRKINDVGYMKGPASFWRRSGAGSASSMVANKWIKLPKEASSSQELKDISVKPIVESITSDSDTDSRALLASDSTVTTEKLEGKDVYKVESADHKTTLWSSADGKFDLLKFVTEEDGERSEVKTSKHDAVPSITAPPEALDPSKFSTSGSDGQTT